MSSTQQTIVKRIRSRSHLARRIITTVSVLALIIGLQSWLHFLKLAPQVQSANTAFQYLVDERQNKHLSNRITNGITGLRSVSDESAWQSDLDELQSEFQGFINAPAEGIEVIKNKVSALNSNTSQAIEEINQLLVDLEQLGDWHHDHFGDVIANLSEPGIFYWPTSMLLSKFYGESFLDAMLFNRGLYLVIVGEVSAGQSILGELRTRLPDSPLRAKVLYTQGRLLYGMGRFEQSVEIVQDSVRMDPELKLAKRFLEFQISKGPDEEVEEEDESVQRVGSASSGGATLF